jgi:hypothetical protein
MFLDLKPLLAVELGLVALLPRNLIEKTME